jgi:hypothetical protein
MDQRDDAGEVAIAGAFAVTIDRALCVHGPGIERGEGVGHAHAAVVVGVDADAAIQFADGKFGDGGDFTRQTTAVGVAEDDEIGAGFFRGLPGGQGVFGIEFISRQRRARRRRSRIYCDL